MQLLIGLQALGQDKFYAHKIGPSVTHPTPHSKKEREVFLFLRKCMENNKLGNDFYSKKKLQQHSDSLSWKDPKILYQFLYLEEYYFKFKSK